MPDTVRGVAALMRGFDDVSRKQMPYAITLMLNKTAGQVKAALADEVGKVFDRPKPFTRNAFAIGYATKQSLTARVYAKDIQARYLQPEVEGGARRLKTFEEKFASRSEGKVALPGSGIKRDQYGGISKAQIMKIARDLNTSGGSKRFFNGTPRGGKALPAGIYARVNNNNRIEPMLVFANDARYEKRFKFSEIVHATVTSVYERNMVEAWNKAMASAKR